ncbi:MAG: homoserine dehydrogenase [Puniceicoccaceae bacterium]|nr:MAG: homoserine dehydrogenase [Puniceicoccaceae bacterium]
MSNPPVRVGLCGLGVVGQGVWQHLDSKAGTLSQRLGGPVVPVRAAVRDPAKPRDIVVPLERLSDDPLALAVDPEIDILCELMGGTGLAREVSLAALGAGKILVTANKALLCEHGAELFLAACRGGGQIFFEASVAGGIPIIKALREGLVANHFPIIEGILNGTCNYILTRMEREGLEYPEVLAEAKRLGYAEADEALDVDGWDSAHKAVILAFLAHGIWVPLPRVRLNGIRRLTQDDIAFAHTFDYRIKLLANIRRDFERGHLAVSVWPTLVPRREVLGNVNEVYNAVAITGDVVGPTVYIGRGAGRDATASAVISDIADAVLWLRGRRGLPLQTPPEAEAACELAPAEAIENCFYLRLTVEDAPGVLAQISSALSAHHVSIASVLQRPGRQAGEACLILTTHRTNQAAMDETLSSLGGLSCVLADPQLMFIGGDLD